LAAALGQPAARLLISPDAGPLIDSALDWRVLGFGLLLAALTAAIFCLAPALQMRNRIMRASIACPLACGACPSKAPSHLTSALKNILNVR